MSLLQPKRPRWARWTAIVLFATTVIFAAGSSLEPWRPGRLGGLAFGILASILFLNAALYPIRRRLRAWPRKTALQWLQFHIYGSVVALWFVFLHVGFAWPVGTQGWWLMFLSIWTTATGLFGVVLQKELPRRLATGLSTEAIYERIPQIIGRLREEAEGLVQHAPRPVVDAFDRHFRSLLSAPRLRWVYVLDVRADRERQLAPLKALSRHTGDEERSSLSALESVVIEKLELDAHASVQRLLKGRLFIHVPPAMALMGLLAVHIGAVLLF